jgi:hypothetical protein
MSAATEQMDKIRAELNHLVSKEGDADFAALCDFDTKTPDNSVFRIKSKLRSDGPKMDEAKLHLLAKAERAHFSVSPYSKIKFHDDSNMFVGFLPVQHNLAYMVAKALPIGMAESDRDEQFENFKMVIDEEAKVLVTKTDELVRALKARH